MLVVTCISHCLVEHILHVYCFDEFADSFVVCIHSLLSNIHDGGLSSNNSLVLSSSQVVWMHPLLLYVMCLSHRRYYVITSSLMSSQYVAEEKHIQANPPHKYLKQLPCERHAIIKHFLEVFKIIFLPL